MSRNPLSYAFASDAKAPPRPSKIERQRCQRHLTISESDDESSFQNTLDERGSHGYRRLQWYCFCCSKETRKKLYVILGRMLGIGFLLIIIYMIYAAIITPLYRDYYELGYTQEDYFGDYWTTVYTLFQMMVDSGGWVYILSEVMYRDEGAWFPFTSFFILVSFISIPLTIVVIDDYVRNLFPPDHQKTETEARLEARMDELANIVDAAAKEKPSLIMPQSNEELRKSTSIETGTEAEQHSYWNLQLRKLVVVISRLLVIGFLLLILYLIYAALLTHLFGDLYENGLTSDDYFSRFDATMISLFTFMVDGGTWSEVQSEVMEVYPWAWMPLLSFFVLSAFLSVPVAIVVVYDAVRNLFPPVQHQTEMDVLLETKMDKLAETLKYVLESQRKKQDEIEKLRPSIGNGKINSPHLVHHVTSKDDHSTKTNQAKGAVVRVTEAIEEDVMAKENENENGEIAGMGIHPLEKEYTKYNVD